MRALLLGLLLGACCPTRSSHDLPLKTNFCGPDIGAYVNGLDAAIGARPGRIVVDCGGGNIATTIHLRPNRVLHFGAGVYTSTANGHVIEIDSNTTVEGEGWNTELQTSTSGNVESVRIITLVSGDSNVYKENITVKNLAFNGLGVVDSCGCRAAVCSFNAHHVVFDTLNFRNMNVIGVQFGGTHYDDVTGFSRDGWIKNSSFHDNGPNAQIAVVNGMDFHIIGNTCTDQLNCVDLEANTEADFLGPFEVTANVINYQQYTLTYGGGVSAGYGILVQGDCLNNGCNRVMGTISGNTLNGTNACPANSSIVNCPGLYSSPRQNFSLAMIRGIFIRGNNILVSNNYIRGAYAIAIYVLGGSQYVKVTGNMITESSRAILIEDSRHCSITDNTILPLDTSNDTDPSAGNYGAKIDEFGTIVDHNVIMGNHLGVNCPNSNCSAYQQLPEITIVGAHSTASGNVLESAY